MASDRNEIRDRELRFRAVHRLSRLVPASDGEAWLAQLTRDGAQALQAGHKGLVAELMICRGILLRDWGVPAEAEFSLRAAAALCAEISDIEGEGKARRELLVLLANPILRLPAENSCGSPNWESSSRLGLAILLNKD